MDQTDIQKIKDKTASSVIYLSIRNIGIQAIAIVGFFVLSILLGTGEVGLFAIVSESVGILGYFSDIGLAAALIQQKKNVTTTELRTSFFVQQLLVLISLIIIALIYPKISAAKSYGFQEQWILISLCFAFVAASLKTIPAVLLERQLNFRLISTIDIIENAVFYIVAVIFALLDYGALSYAIATFLRSTVGLVLMYQKSPWPIGFSFSFRSIKHLFKFSIPYQLNSFIAVIKDKFSNLLVAGIIGREFFGILAWAQKASRIPLSLMDAIMRVTFPAFSRLQDQKELLSKSIERSIYFIAFFIFPTLGGIALIAPDLINIIPKYTKWEPALIPLYLYILSNAIAAVTTPIINAFNATGLILLSSKFMVMWTVLTWVFFPILSIKFGYIGTSVAMLLVGLSSVIVWYYAYKKFSLNIIKTLVHPTIASILMIFCLLLFQTLNLSLILILIGKIVIGIAVYSFYHFLFSKNEIKWFLNQLIWFRNKKYLNWIPWLKKSKIIPA